jgi:uncharacterized damage-inducible protein DinB
MRLGVLHCLEPGSQGAITMRNPFRILCCLLFVFVGHAALAQGRLTATQALDYWITVTQNEVVPTAAAMPEEKYSFAPRGPGFAGVRTFAQQVKHLAANNYRMAGYIMGTTPTPEEESETGPDGVRTKAQIMDYLEISFKALHRAVATINETNLLKPLADHPTPQNTRFQLAEDVVAHSFNHYGQMVEYLRMNGIIPPASRR